MLWKKAASPRIDRLHIGCGQAAIPGWLNIDRSALPGVERVLDVRQGLPFREVSFIFAEHFLEHLSLDEGLAFLCECRRTLAGDGVLRLSTPNLDWVMVTQYQVGRSDPGEALLDALRMNRAFHGWGHRFLYNRTMLEMALRAAGFAEITFEAHGESRRDALRGLERHEKYVDSEEFPHVLIPEAAGRATPVPLPETYLPEDYRDVAVG